MSTRFFTNEDHNTLLKKFEGVFTHNQNIQFFDALVGYFRASGYFALRPHLEHVPNIRILVGINVDKLLARSHSKGMLFKGNPQQTIEAFLEEAKRDVQNANYSSDVEAGILQFIEDVASKKIEIKAHPERKLHAKIYIFRPDPFNEHTPCSVITGSSNLTHAGLGGDGSNYEFNVLLNNYDDVKFATDEFEKLWKEGVPVLPVEIGKLKQETYLNDEFTPYELYIKFLVEYFGKSVEFDPSSVSDLPKGFKRLSYQVDAVNQGFDLLRKHNGFFLADVVGLGKTIVATLIAKKFFYTNGYPSHNSRTLIVVPPALKDNWQETLDDFGLPNYRVITNGSLHKIQDPTVYDLVIVDEAHKFRNDTAEAYDALQRLCKSPTRQQLPDGSLARKKIILVSATPLNNRPDDIRNQVFLFQDGKDSTLEVANLQRFFNQASEQYEKAKKLPSMPEVQAEVRSIYDRIREKVVKPLTVRRTRTDLKENEEYAKDLDEQGIIFPDINPPEQILYKLDAELEALYDRTMGVIRADDHALSYARYRAIEFLAPQYKMKYANADLLSSQLSRIMRTLLAKRIDSSFFAFKKSLHRFKQATDAMITMFENDRVYIAPNLNVTEHIVDEKEDKLIEEIERLRETDPTITTCTAKDFQPGFLELLRKDAEILGELVEAWDQVEQDPKLDEFVKQLNTVLLTPETNPQKKLVVFSESSETTTYLKERLAENGFDRVLTVNAKNRHALRHTIRENFDANLPHNEYRNDYDIIISTEVLAEGVNLHRSNVIVNYDTPWNATRLMQRIGRVNRIGSVAPVIHNFLFYPTAQVDSDIELQKKAMMKLQAFHSALGEDSQIYSQDEEVRNFGLFDAGVQEERDEHLVFLMELRKFKEDHPEQFRIIRNMPLRARTGRKDKTKTGSTTCFIRNPRRDAFYHVSENGELEELTFVECARIFKADLPEKALPLHDKHHEQVSAAKADFSSKLQEEITQSVGLDAHQSPHEKKALTFLDAFLHLPITGEQERFKINAAKTAIRLARFQKLQRDVNRLQTAIKKKKMTNVELLDALMAIINKYPLDDVEESAPRPATQAEADQLEPDIIISESFARE
ncbi:MAG: helicase [Planctomycetes bacterium]|nr:helicase [Planctomycetota bacterium]